MLKQILVVDDMAVFREPFAAALRLEGFQTITAADGAEALRHLQGGNVGLVLLDLAMPGIDGFALLAKMRAHPDWRGIPVIVLTALTGEEHVLKAASLGVQGFLLKRCFSLPKLFERVRKHLRAAPSSATGEALAAALSGGVAASLRTRAGAGQEVPGAHVAVGAATAVLEPPGRRSAAATPGSVGAAPRPPVGRCPVLLSREETLERLAKVAGPKTFAGVVAQVFAIAGSPRADLSDLVNVLQGDPVLAARVLQVANSAAYTTQKIRIATMEDAVRRIGLKTIQSIALAVGIFEAFPPDAADGFNTMRSWQHCFAVSAIIGQLLQEQDADMHGVAHMVGLCHDLAGIMLRQHFAEEYCAIITHAKAANLPMHQVEAVALGVSHHELVTQMLSNLGLPATISGPIREHVERETGGAQGALPARLTRALGMANLLAHALQLAPSPESTVAPITRAEWKVFARDVPPPTLDAMALRNNVLTTTMMLARLPSADEQKLMEPYFKLGGKRVWYVRSSVFSEIDPVEVALQLMADVQTHPRLPATDREWEGIGAVIVVAPRADVSPLSKADVRRALERAPGPRPVLFLSAQGEADQTGHVTWARYPVSLARLHEFLYGGQGASGY